MDGTLVQVSDAVFARLLTLVEQTGTDVETVLLRLLERDPHDHDHVCPTCARMTRWHERRTPDLHQHELFSLG